MNAPLSPLVRKIINDRRNRDDFFWLTKKAQREGEASGKLYVDGELKIVTIKTCNMY